MQRVSDSDVNNKVTVQIYKSPHKVQLDSTRVGQTLHI